ncbi:MAG: alpha/beta hydrolase [Candidatus Wolfebacteria bacterium]|nr:alpha/beta hydrolase [Candidatus Wolfebacteria bacterium]
MEPLVVLHGWGSSAKSFERLSQYLKERGIEAFVFGLPGFGEATPPKEPWAIDDYADYVLKKLESENIGKFYLMGHSFGGRISIKIAANHPGKLKGLILCDAAGITPRPKLKISIFAFASKIGNAVFSFSFLKPLWQLAKKFVYYMSRQRDYYYLQNEIMRETFKKVINEDLVSYLNKIKTPTLVVWGKKDKLTPVSDAYTMNMNIVGSELVVLKNVGHSPHLEVPRELAGIIYGFMNQ